MRLYAIGDIHLGHKLNLESLASLRSHPEHGLILCGDVGETAEHLHAAFEKACACFKHVFWVPGNHELYTMPGATEQLKGEDKYQVCVEIARQWGVLTPEDPYMRWEGEGGPCIIALVFTLYDYTFRPDDVSREDALAWALKEGIQASDEFLLHPDPHETRDAWCQARVTRTETRLQEAADLVYIPAIPRFSLWCGTKQTHDWHVWFNASVIVTGHLHVRRTDWIDGVRFEVCSLDYPRQWQEARDMGADINSMLREILPGPPAPSSDSVKTIWRRHG
ncbi:hypothetical protein LTR66_012826 [Elasticomyces elasticus]|nr:hypothetical protein LTR66_012826 [Elasticomyces elasticus]